jgi:hypothetical protein
MAQGLDHRTVLGATLVVVLAASAVRAGDRDAALVVVDAAVKAHGGADALDRAQTALRTASGTLKTFGKDAPFTEELVWQLPQRLRRTLEIGSGPDRSRLVIVVAADKGWQTTGGMVTELGTERLRELHEDAYLLWLATLTPLRQEGVELSPLPESRLDGRPVLSIRASGKGHADVRLSFDKESGLLVKIGHRVQEAGQAVEKEYVYGDPRAFEGVKLPTKVQELHDGRRFAERTGITYKFPRPADEAAFSRP